MEPEWGSLRGRHRRCLRHRRRRPRCSRSFSCAQSYRPGEVCAEWWAEWGAEGWTAKPACSVGLRASSKGSSHRICPTATAFCASRSSIASANAHQTISAANSTSARATAAATYTSRCPITTAIRPTATTIRSSNGPSTSPLHQHPNKQPAIRRLLLDLLTLVPAQHPRRPGRPLPRQLLAHKMELPTRPLHLVLQPRQELLHHHKNTHNLHHRPLNRQTSPPRRRRRYCHGPHAWPRLLRPMHCWWW